MAIAVREVVGLQIRELKSAQRMVLDALESFMVRLEREEFYPAQVTTESFARLCELSRDAQDLNTEIEKHILFDEELSSHVDIMDNTIESYADRFWKWTDRQTESVTEAMARHNRSRSTIYRWIKSGKLNAYKEGRRWIIAI